jgi:hypothetical protein
MPIPRTNVFVHNMLIILWINFDKGAVGLANDQYFLIYQEANDEECLLTIQPYSDEQTLAEAINQLQARQLDEYTIIKGRKMKATLRVAVDLTEIEDTGDK